MELSTKLGQSSQSTFLSKCRLWSLNALKAKLSYPKRNSSLSSSTEVGQRSPKFNQNELSACIAIHVTGEGRCGQTEFFTFGGPLTLPFKPRKAWPNAADDLELAITINDLNSIVWPRGKTVSPWIDSKDNKVSYRWINVDPQSSREDTDALDELDTENELNCTGWCVRLNIRPKSSTELRIDALLIPVKLESLKDDAFPYYADGKFPAFRVGGRGGETAKILRTETGPDYFGIGIFPFLVDLRPNHSPLPCSFHVKLAVASLLRSSQDP